MFVKKMYKEKLFQFLFHPLISNSSILVFGSLVASFFSFLFSIFVLRNLSPIEYGIVASLVSLSSLATMPAGAITNTVVRFAATFFAHGELGKAKYLFLKINKSFFIAGVLFFFVFTVFSHQIGSFFNIQDNMLMILVGLNVFASLLATTNPSFLQARLSFRTLASISIFGSLLKLLLGVIFVFLGFAAGGVMWAFFISTLIPYISSFFPLRFLLDKKVETTSTHIKLFASYGIPATITLFAITSFATSDIILVKHFFPPLQAGMYAGLSLIGKVIFFLTGPVATVMFPMIVQRHAKEQRVFNLFLASLFIVAFPSVIMVIFYYLIPVPIISIFSKTYIPVAGILGFFGLFISVYALLMVTVNFYLAIKKTWVCIPVAIMAFLQIVLIWYFHKDFYEIILISFSLSLLLFSGLLFYYFLYERQKKS